MHVPCASLGSFSNSRKRKPAHHRASIIFPMRTAAVNSWAQASIRPEASPDLPAGLVADATYAMTAP